ncbi:methyltransferase domain-containing protein [Candidatus Wolfebacteria bacterium]|nr:methyltransferase domain-containing protein [Candidatus Wolfebacteria bacterium]
MINYIAFVKSFFKNPLRVGALVPSSPYLAEKMVDLADFSGAKCVVEFGSGTGAVTKKILQRLPEDCVLLSFEIEKSFAERLEKTINDKRLIIINDGAEQLAKYLKKYGHQEADYIISCLPLASLPKDSAEKILEIAKNRLKNGGHYIQFQYSLNDFGNLKKVFSKVRLGFEIRNFPPAFIYICEKF